VCRDDRVLRFLHFAPHAVEAEQREMPAMVRAVILERMSATDDVAAKLGVALRLAADAEKCRPDLMAIEHVEHLRRHFPDRGRRQNVIATSLRAAASSGSRVQFGPQHPASRRHSDHAEHQVIDDHSSDRPAPFLGLKNQHEDCGQVQEDRQANQQRRAPCGRYRGLRIDAAARGIRRQSGPGMWWGTLRILWHHPLACASSIVEP
jgi:hypothetical protein